MHNRYQLFTYICAGVLVAALLGVVANASPVAPKQSTVTDIIKARMGSACCRTTMRCVRKSAGQCSEWKLITTSVCPGVICR
jgi:hypothetical protein